ncbi:hypothetical protein [Desulfomonile tiedjei]|nr:hypothetical protein [Desulfomonile tiedjei]
MQAADGVAELDVANESKRSRWRSSWAKLIEAGSMLEASQTSFFLEFS